MVQFGRVFCRPVGFLVIEPLDPFRHRVRYHGDGMIADHRIGLLAGQLPDGQPAALFVLADKGLIKSTVRFWLVMVYRGWAARNVSQSEKTV